MKKLILGILFGLLIFFISCDNPVADENAQSKSTGFILSPEKDIFSTDENISINLFNKSAYDCYFPHCNEDLLYTVSFKQDTSWGIYFRTGCTRKDSLSMRNILDIGEQKNFSFQVDFPGEFMMSMYYAESLDNADLKLITTTFVVE